MIQHNSRATRTPDSPGSYRRRSDSYSSSQATLPRLGAVRHPSESAPEQSSSSYQSAQRSAKRSAASAGFSASPQFSTNAPPGPTPTATQRSSGSEKRQKSSKDKSVRPQSSLSLPTFRRKWPKLYYVLAGSKEERLVAVDPEIIREMSPEALKMSSVIWSGGRSNVFGLAVKNESGSDEYIAVKVVVLNDQLTEDRALAEYHMLRSLQHNHIIAAVGAYRQSDGQSPQIGSLLYPLAPWNLTQRIRMLSEKNDKRLKDRSQPWVSPNLAKKLLSYFPCLTHAVLYLHHQVKPIKHKDIKPENILIDKDDIVILADFGDANSYPDEDQVISQGPTVISPRYAPKSTVDGKSQRGFDRDIVCLGYVYLEMANVIFGETIAHFESHLRSKAGVQHPVASGSYNKVDPIYWKLVEDGRIGSWMDHLQELAAEHPDRVPMEFTKVNQFLDMILKMMKAGLKDRNVLRDAYDLFCDVRGGDPCEHCAAVNIPGPEDRSTRRRHLSAPPVVSRSIETVSVRRSTSHETIPDAGAEVVATKGYMSTQSNEEDTADLNADDRAAFNSDPTLVAPDQEVDPIPIPSVSISRTGTDFLHDDGHLSHQHSRAPSPALDVSFKHSAISHSGSPSNYPTIPHTIPEQDTKTEASSTRRNPDLDDEQESFANDKLEFESSHVRPDRRKRKSADISNPPRQSTKPFTTAAGSSNNLLERTKRPWVCMLDPRHDMAAVKSTRAVKPDCLGVIYALPRRRGSMYRNFLLPGDMGTLDLRRRLPLRAKVLGLLGLLDTVIIIKHDREREAEK